MAKKKLVIKKIMPSFHGETPQFDCEIDTGIKGAEASGISIEDYVTQSKR